MDDILDTVLKKKTSSIRKDWGNEHGKKKKNLSGKWVLKGT
jgi:hypothetical protein